MSLFSLTLHISHCGISLKNGSFEMLPPVCAFSKLDCKLDDVEDGVDHAGEAEEGSEEEFPVDEEFINNLPQV